MIDPISSEVTANISSYLDAVRACPASQAESPVMVPGDGLCRRRAERIANGIPVAQEVWDEICALAQAPQGVLRRQYASGAGAGRPI